MKPIIDKILLFTLSACPMGRSIKTVLNEVCEQYPQIKLETIFVEMEPDSANAYRIKVNPTSVFIDDKGHELTRFEGFKETSEVTSLIESILKGEINTTEYSDNQEVVENYTIYLLKDQTFEPINVSYRNKTSIKAPRITALHLQIEYQQEGFMNPFPKGTKLELVQFQKDYGIISIQFNQNVYPDQLKTMEKALTLTLSHFGITQIEINKIDQ